MEFWRLVVVPVVRVALEVVIVVVLTAVVLCQPIIVFLQTRLIVLGPVLSLPIPQDHRQVHLSPVGLIGMHVPRIVSVAVSIVNLLEVTNTVLRLRLILRRREGVLMVTQCVAAEYINIVRLVAG
jgi:hypothetical protein